MADILLINMPIRLHARPNVVPTGVGILAAMAEKLGHRCFVLDLNSLRPEATGEQIEKFLRGYVSGFDCVGLSGMITTLRRQILVAGLVRQVFPETCLISGGGLASDLGDDLFAWIPELDVVVKGEGEPHLAYLLENHRLLRRSKKVLGPEVVHDLDDVPSVAWDKFDLNVYLKNPIWGQEAGNSSWTSFSMERSVNLISSRGCPYSCHFCDREATGGRRYRLCSSQRLIEDVDQVMERFSVDFIGFVDDNFISDRKRLLELLPLLKTRNIHWGCHGRLNEIDRDLAVSLRKSGCLYIGFGGESADSGILKRMNKKNSPEQMAAGIRACQQADIVPNCTWIMGYPGETRKSLRRTAAFILEHGLSQKNMFVATAYPGTEFFRQVRDKIISAYESLYEYVLDLDDASKILEKNGALLNYSDMPDQEFLECKRLVEEGRMDLI